MGSLVSIGTAAKELGVHPATLRRWEEEGKIDDSSDFSRVEPIPKDPNSPFRHIEEL